jgi:hypothetical protein
MTASHEGAAENRIKVGEDGDKLEAGKTVEKTHSGGDVHGRNHRRDVSDHERECECTRHVVRGARRSRGSGMLVSLPATLELRATIEGEEG